MKNMKIEILQEVTNWETNTPNHTYAIDKESGKMVAYQPLDGEIKVFNKPLQFSKSFRKFKKIINQEMLNLLGEKYEL